MNTRIIGTVLMLAISPLLFSCSSKKGGEKKGAEKKTSAPLKNGKNQSRR
ncbi:hypothetical protein Q7M76_04155 [Candidatus Liberibacter asiaticus]|uniref:Lipoprotein n=2 Tax=Liberibacter asiaticus TaxID=34021 RepID=C6XGC1_LIBAP|nr:hypothetical protein [Candidatus Liberibacter asiaticus]ACT57424.1 hypothetical protein CLIBASIA_04250 [Candidatus Liberibacter asiaticus str. psy62]AGH17187.1 hypothetical protein WSI_04085 [Candidatus Liberibacter asiaticus str. gxpsy]KAE9509864.1 hypothetical protein FXW22_04100 [Candidatus Liberibacter asiaticus]KAE9511341.1 hypothetical protein FXW31_02015 [Candidatus Liberibacter asiaticus]KAE9512005.1 hypothetical protein FXW32_04080 [Candidatus Liberibacter asiaticus]